MTGSIPTLYVLNRNYSSWSLRAWLALRALGVNFETVVLTVGTKELPDVDHPDFPVLMARAGPTSKVNTHIPILDFLVTPTCFS